MKKNVIIAAGGQGMRMGAQIPKQFLLLGDKPVLMHTIECFRHYCSSINIVVVLPEAQIDYWNALCLKHSFDVPHTTVSGGETRFHSVLKGIEAIDNDGLTAVHDAVRPFVSDTTVSLCFDAAANYGAAIPVLESVESIRRVDGTNSYACSRSEYRMVQTPQVFKMELLRNAYRQPYSETFTDDASVVEAASGHIALVEGNRENIKLTSLLDMKIGEVILAGQYWR
ncbi:MAG: 2-C-methyl-D-erythritol 4-phosphate cytidylyltransferase [Cytophagaceae bacterium]|jgi:2-C-methyl-D-erythritol 4-phosphate cytidylyltransferase|nr:2-C-methyl-D-erythritol 4-phosphate cytidylyltransferase [Cytophagaceae bacterium]